MAGLATNKEYILNHKEIEIWRNKKVRIEGAFFAEHLWLLERLQLQYLLQVLPLGKQEKLLQTNQQVQYCTGEPKSLSDIIKLYTPDKEDS